MKSILRVILAPALAITSTMVAALEQAAGRADIDPKQLRKDAKRLTHKMRMSAERYAQQLEDRAEGIQAQGQRAEREAKAMRQRAEEIREVLREAERDADQQIEKATDKPAQRTRAAASAS